MSGDPLDMVGIGHGWYGYNLQPRASADDDGSARRPAMGEAGRGNSLQRPSLMPGRLMADELFSGVEGQHTAGAAATAPLTSTTTQGTPQPFPSALPGNMATNDNTSELLWSHSHAANLQHEQLQYLLQHQHQHMLQQHHSPSPCVTGYSGSSNNRLGNNNNMNDNAAAILAPWATIPTLQQQRWCYVTETPLNNNDSNKTSPTANMRATPDLSRSTGDNILNYSLEFGMMDASAGTGSCTSISCSDVRTPRQQQPHDHHQQQQRYFEQQLGAIAAAAAAGGEGASSGASDLGIWGAGAGGAGTEQAGARPSEQVAQGSPKGGWISSFSTSSMGSSQDLDASEIKRQERNAREQRRSLRTSQQFDKLRALLIENGIQPKANKSSLLSEVVKFIQQLEESVEGLKEDRQRWIEETADVPEVARQDPNGGAIDCKQVFAHASVALVMANVEGRVMESNLQFERLSGYSGGELKQLTLLSLTSPSDLQQTFELLSAMLTDGTGKASKHVSAKAMLKSGDCDNLSLSLTLARDALGRPKFFLCHLLPQDHIASTLSSSSAAPSTDHGEEPDNGADNKEQSRTEVKTCWGMPRRPIDHRCPFFVVSP